MYSVKCTTKKCIKFLTHTNILIIIIIIIIIILIIFYKRIRKGVDLICRLRKQKGRGGGEGGGGIN